MVVGAILLGVCALAGLLLVIGSVQRSLAYGRLLDENLALKSRLGEIEGKLDSVDQELQRLRMYDAQLQDLPEGTLPGFGPMDADDVAAGLGEGVIVDRGRMELLGESGDPMDALPLLDDGFLDERLARVEMRAEPPSTSD